MGAFQILLFVSILVGICIIIFSLITFSNDNKAKPETVNNSSYILHSMSEADKAIEELDKTAKTIFEELEGKYQELLFLYSLIDDKKNEVKNMYSHSQTEIVPPPHKTVKYANPKLEKLRELKNSGMEVPEIAKSMNMGQGEVKLILELGRDR